MARGAIHGPASTFEGSQLILSIAAKTHAGTGVVRDACDIPCRSGAFLDDKPDVVDAEWYAMLASRPPRARPSGDAELKLVLVGNITGRFFVPRYQRGYRWGEQEVTQLLEGNVSRLRISVVAATNSLASPSRLKVELNRG